MFFTEQERLSSYKGSTHGVVVVQNELGQVQLIWRYVHVQILDSVNDAHFAAETRRADHREPPHTQLRIEKHISSYTQLFGSWSLASIRDATLANEPYPTPPGGMYDEK